MSEYVTLSEENQGGPASPGAVVPSPGKAIRPPGKSADADLGEPIGEPTHRGRVLVTSPISQQRGIEFDIFPRSLRVRRPFTGAIPTPPDRAGQTLQGFSDKSRGRLRFTAANSQHLTAQFCCTYHNFWPIDGREFKAHLHAFLVSARRAFPFLEYLWVAEFQTRGAPHAHVYLNVEPTFENRVILARLWCRLIDPNGADPEFWAFHTHSKNLIPWRMLNGGYLCKYLDKEHQKVIPDGFRNFGRWWGNSRGLVPEPDTLTGIDLAEKFPQVDTETGEIHGDAVRFLLRTVGRYHEKVNRRSWFRRTNKTATALTGAPVFLQALAYLKRTRNIPPDPIPF